jgi:hypothetical protein
LRRRLAETENRAHRPENPKNVDQIIANRLRMYLSEASRDLPVAVSRCPRRPFGKVLPSELRRIAAGLLSPAASKLTLTRARLMTMGIAIHGLALHGSPGGAQADCAAGDGVITTPGACSTPQILTASTGTIVAGATLNGGLNTTAYTILSNNATVTNSGAVTGLGLLPAFPGEKYWRNPSKQRVDLWQSRNGDRGESKRKSKHCEQRQHSWY